MSDAATTHDQRKWPHNSPWAWQKLHGIEDTCRKAGVDDRDLLDVIYKVYNDANRAMRPRTYTDRDRIDSDNRAEAVEAITVFGNVFNSAVDEQDRRYAARGIEP